MVQHYVLRRSDPMLPSARSAPTHQHFCDNSIWDVAVILTKYMYALNRMELIA